MLLNEAKERWKAALSQRGPCPRCDSLRVWFNGVRLRKASVRQGEETVFVADIPVRRLRCGDCVWRWSVAPGGRYQLRPAADDPGTPVPRRPMVPLDLSLAQPLSTAEQVAAPVLDCIADGKSECMIPAVSGVLGTLGYVLPGLRRLLLPMMQQRGRKNRERYRTERAAQGRP